MGNILENKNERCSQVQRKFYLSDNLVTLLGQ